MTVGSRLIFLGILARVFMQKQNGQVVANQVPTTEGASITFSQMIDLGVVFKAKAVLETVLNALRDEGELP